MDKSIRGALRGGLPMLMIGVCGGQVLAQTPIALQPLLPISKSEKGVMSPLPPPSVAPKGVITLEKIPQAVPAIPVSAPMNVLPIQRETQTTPNVQARQAKFRVDDLVRNPVDISNIFSKVKIEPSTEPVESAHMIRYQKTAGMGDFEWTPNGYCWQSPAFCYSPLYFEQPNLERYGNSTFPALAPAVSMTYFLGQVTMLPLKSIHQTPWSKSCTLGHHRPGDCAPFQRRNSHHVQTFHQQVPSIPTHEDVIWSESPVVSGNVEPENQAVVQGQVDQASAVSPIPPTSNPIRVKMSD